ncbi:hypothetical protein [Bradyrhizobium sp.]
MFKTETGGAILELTMERAPVYAYASDVKTVVVTPSRSLSSRGIDG